MESLSTPNALVAVAVVVDDLEATPKQRRKVAAEHTGENHYGEMTELSLTVQFFPTL